MARHETVYSVFVASPSDVDDERTSLEGVIRELNSVWSRELGIRLELIKWETHSIPGIGVDAQSVINEAVPSDYDIFIGMMWHRFGSPTGRAGSGTAEEFEIARRRLGTSQSPRVLFYFRSSSPISLSDIDASQLASVNEFREKIGNEGTYYWKYKDPSEFETIARVHLSRIVNSLKAKNEKSDLDTFSAGTERALNPPMTYDDEIGLFDYIDLFEENITKSNISLENITRESNIYANRINQSASDLNSISSNQSHSLASKNEARRIISRTAADMQSFAERTATETPIYRESFKIAIDSFTNVLVIQSDFARTDESNTAVTEAVFSMDILHQSLKDVIVSISEFRQKVSETPRMSGELNRAKRSIVSSTDDLVSELETSINLILSARELARRLGY